MSKEDEFYDRLFMWCCAVVVVAISILLGLMVITEVTRWF